MPRAVWNGTVIAESPHCEIVEGNQYFPPDSVRREFLRPSEKRTECGWKGTASYYDIAADGKLNKDAAWYYPQIKPAAKNIEGYVAFWQGVTIGD